MRRLWILPIALCLTCGSSAYAESFVAAVGDYYKERSTRVMAPSLSTRLELPDEWRVDGRFLVDQITSASGAFTATDEPFTERRYAGDLAVQKRFGNLLPSVNFNYSDETDYTSVSFGAAATVFLDDDLITLGGSIRYADDSVGRRTSDSSSGARQQGADEFADKLRTVHLGINGSMVINPNLVLGGAFKVQVRRGFTENVYRREQHPRAVEDYSIGAFARYRHAPSRLGFNLDLCLHASSWGHVAVSPQIQVWWQAARWLSVVPMLRAYMQPNGAFFDVGAERPDPNDPTGDPLIFNTQDPTLFAHNTMQTGVRLELSPPAWGGLRVMPAYYFRYQDTLYGNAHIAQLGLYFPFSL